MKNEILTAYKDHINNITPITMDIWDEIEVILNPREIKKDEFILKEHQKCNQEIFVYKGIIRVFYYDSTEEINVSFYQDNELLCPHFGRTKNGRSNFNLQAITPAIVFEFEQDVMKKIRYKYPELIDYGYLVVENELRRKNQYEIFLSIKDAKDRYQKFLEMYPSLENKISQYQIASFLRITPVSLSRLRKKMVKK
jgi:CRP-like cAMP-binding protein